MQTSTPRVLTTEDLLGVLGSDAAADFLGVLGSGTLTGTGNRIVLGGFSGTFEEATAGMTSPEGGKTPTISAGFRASLGGAAGADPASADGAVISRAGVGQEEGDDGAGFAAESEEAGVRLTPPASAKASCTVSTGFGASSSGATGAESASTDGAVPSGAGVEEGEGGPPVATGEVQARSWWLSPSDTTASRRASRVRASSSDDLFAGDT